MTTPRAAAGQDFLVRRDDWQQCRFMPAEVPAELRPGQVLFWVDRFAFTANNISYALSGDMLGYWSFFPTGEEGWGRIPVMGFADVIRSQHPEVPEGERVFGFFPMSTHLVIEAERVGPQRIVDGAPHRSQTAPAYREYSRIGGDPLYAADREDEHMLLRGLFMTAFLIDDFLDEEGFFGAEAVVLSSASSKTAIALAFLLARRRQGRVIGLTSPRNAAFVESLGFYDRVLAYDEVPSLSADEPVVFVDMAGDGKVVHAVHHHFGDSLKHSCGVGATHWDAERTSGELPGARPQFFFAPARIQKRNTDWGAEGLAKRLGEGWQGFVASSDAWLEIVRGYGSAALERVYRETLAGRTSPRQGQVLSLHERGA